MKTYRTGNVVMLCISMLIVCILGGRLIYEKVCRPKIASDELSSTEIIRDPGGEILDMSHERSEVVLVSPFREVPYIVFNQHVGNKYQVTFEISCGAGAQEVFEKTDGSGIFFTCLRKY